MITEDNPLGNIYISHRAIASIAHHAALESYGVVGLAAKNLAEGLAQAIVKDPTLGVEIGFDGTTVQIDIYIIVEYGVRIKSVASLVADSVGFNVENTLGIPMETVNVNIHVRGLRISDTD
jgi:uncharacterized alkaline shock family protein YloU